MARNSATSCNGALLVVCCWWSVSARNMHRRSNLELRGPENDLKFRPRRSRPRASTPFCAPSPM
eukprot:8889000-Alexandrium_andersonii.AAC.1